MAVTHIDVLDVSIADSWVSPSNKTGSGNGEAKIYVGQRTSQSYRDFFGQPGFRLKCRFRRSDLLRFLDEMKVEYWFPTFPYRAGPSLRDLWTERRKLVEAEAGEFINFRVEEQVQLEGPRGYINSNDEGYQFLRELPLPGTSILKILKLQDEGELIYEFRLMPDYEGHTRRSIEDQLREVGPASVGSTPSAHSQPTSTTTERMIKARLGQQRFKQDVLRQCESTCAFTSVSDETLLIAGHIKPWSVSSDTERLDPQNGLVFTPTYDKLFDSGLVSFTDSGKLLISPLVSRDTAHRLHIVPNMEISVPLLGSANTKRREYMDYHREHQFRR